MTALRFKSKDFKITLSKNQAISVKSRINQQKVKITVGLTGLVCEVNGALMLSAAETGEQ